MAKKPRMSPKAHWALKDQFKDWIDSGDWDQTTLCEPHDPQVLSRIVSSEDLAQEIHQIRYDLGRESVAQFMTEYRGRLLQAGCTAEEIVQALDFIDLHHEHSH